jgi:hypothetical protein
MESAYGHINKILLVETEEQEFNMFKKFLSFDDVESALMKLKEKYLLGVVSDT